jgi:hypothetical protein
MNEAAAAILVDIASINRRRQELVAAQDADNAEFRAHRMSGTRFLKQWRKRQTERIALETRYFWLLVNLEEVNNENVSI